MTGPRVPEPEAERRLISGISATLLRIPRDPLVAIRVLFHVGSVDDPSGREGLAGLTGALMAQGGSRRRPYPEILEALYPMAASVSVRTEKETTVFSGTVHRDNATAYYELLREILLEPGLGEQDLNRLRSDRLNYLIRHLRSTDDETLAKEALGATMYAGHPYGRPDAGTVRGLASVEVEDVRRFYESRFGRDRVEFGLAGGFEDTLAERIAVDLAGLPEASAPRPAIPEPRPPRGIEATVVTKPTRAWAVSIGFPLDVNRSDEAFYPLMLANSYLGEHRTFNGVLMKRMRADRGLNYGDYSYIEHFVQDGGSTFPLPNAARSRQAFSIWIRPVAPQNTHFAVRQALREVRRLAENGMGLEAFEATREFLLHYRHLWVQTGSRRLGYELDGGFYGVGSLVDEIGRRAPGWTVADVNDAARHHLRLDGAYLAVVADPEGAPDFAEALVRNAPSPVTYDTDTRPEVLEEDESVSRFPMNVEPTRVRIVPAAELFEV